MPTLFSSSTDWYLSTICGPAGHKHDAEGVRACMIERLAELRLVGTKQNAEAA